MVRQNGPIRSATLMTIEQLSTTSKLRTKIKKKLQSIGMEINNV